MKLITLYKINGLILNSQRPIKLHELVFTNDFAYYHQVFSNPGLERAIGLNAKRNLIEGTLCCYGELDVAVPEGANSADELHLALSEQWRVLSTLLNFLWFSKECGVYVEYVVGFAYEFNWLQERHLAEIKVDSQGLSISTEFSASEVVYANDCLNRFSSVLGERGLFKRTNESRGDNLVFSGDPGFDYSTRTRIERAVMFGELARSEVFIPMRISLWAPCLESLFTTDSAEVTFKVAMRVALFVGKDKNSRFRVFNTVKDAYNLRSRFLHGETFTDKKHKSEASLLQLSRDIEEIARAVLDKILLLHLEDFSTDERLNDLIKRDLIFT